MAVHFVSFTFVAVIVALSPVVVLGALDYAPFPTNYADIDFLGRIDVARPGYEIYKDENPYEEIKIEQNAPKKYDIEIENIGFAGIGEAGAYVEQQDCFGQIQHAVDDYFLSHPWGNISGAACTETNMGAAKTQLAEIINNFFKTNSVCKDKYSSSKNGLYNWAENEKFYAKINIYYDTSDGTNVVKRLDIKACCDKDVNMDCLELDNK